MYNKCAEVRINATPLLFVSMTTERNRGLPRSLHTCEGSLPAMDLPEERGQGH